MSSTEPDTTNNKEEELTTPPWKKYMESLTSKKEHPIYFRSNSVYGSKKPTDSQKAETRFNKGGKFTKAFVGTSFQNSGLNTTKTTSKIHKSLDGGF